MPRGSVSGRGQRRKGSLDALQRPKRLLSAKRTSRACDRCRFKKSKCDGLQPCETCQLNDRICLYSARCARDTRDWYNRMQDVIEEGFQRLYKATRDANVFPGVPPSERDGKASIEQILRGMGLRTETMPCNKATTRAKHSPSPSESATTERSDLDSCSNEEVRDSLTSNWHNVTTTAQQVPIDIASSSSTKGQEWPAVERPYASREPAVDMQMQFQIAVGTNLVSDPATNSRRKVLQHSFRGALHDRIRNLSVLGHSTEPLIHGQNVVPMDGVHHHHHQMGSPPHKQFHPSVDSTYPQLVSDRYRKWSPAHTAVPGPKHKDMDMDVNMYLNHDGIMTYPYSGGDYRNF